MKVLIVHPKVPIYGGAEKAIVRLCDYMRSHDIEHALAMPSLPNGMKDDLHETPIITDKIVPVNDFDIVNFHNFPATLYATYCTRPMVWMANEPPEMFSNWKRKPVESFNRWLVKNRIKNAIVNDEFNGQRLADIYGVNPTVIYPGVDFEYFSQIDRHPDPDYFTVLQVGTITPYKNQLATVKAVGELKKKIKNIRLWLVGASPDADYKNQVMDAISECKIDFFSFGYISREWQREMMSKADVLMHPVKSQGGWLVPFEAISAGIPVIVSPELTFADMMRREELGIVTRDYDTAIETLFRFGPATNGYLDRCKQWVKENLTWEKHSELTIKEFERILNK